MIYKIVDFCTGEQIEDTSDQSLKKLKRSLRFLNIGSRLLEGAIQYAIACYLPSQAFVVTGKYFNPISIKELTVNEREIFWKYYATHSSYEIPSSEFKAIAATNNE
jgi:hypothetical protein